MAVPTLNTTIGISEQSWTHFVFRAVENQVPVVSTDRGFYSIITDNHGKFLLHEGGRLDGMGESGRVCFLHGIPEHGRKES